jgi:hypothetical protein
MSELLRRRRLCNPARRRETFSFRSSAFVLRLRAARRLAGAPS